MNLMGKSPYLRGTSLQAYDGGMEGGETSARMVVFLVSIFPKIGPDTHS